MGYYLADGIYPTWATLVKSISLPQGNKRQYFAKAQEAARKMVERAFGVLQARFAIVRGPVHIWDKDTISQIMRACVIIQIYISYIIILCLLFFIVMDKSILAKHEMNK